MNKYIYKTTKVLTIWLNLFITPSLLHKLHKFHNNKNVTKFLL